jgi:hypothetical protein
VGNGDGRRGTDSFRLDVRTFGLRVTRTVTFSADVFTDTSCARAFLHGAARRTVESVTDLLTLRQWKRFSGWLCGLRARSGGGFPGCVTEVDNVKFRVHVKPGLGGTLLVLLEVGNNVVEDVREIVTEMSVKSDLREPEGEARATFWCIRRTDRSVNRPGKHESGKVAERDL